MKAIPVILLVVGFSMSGCLSWSSSEELPAQFVEEEKRYSFQAKTLNRSIDQGANFDLHKHADGALTLLIWVSPACGGCHDWIQDMKQNGVHTQLIENDVKIVSIHRYFQFENVDDVMEEYGNQSSDSYNPWPVVVPNDDVRAIDLSTGMITDIGIIEAFGSPGTPTLQLIDGDGRMVWESASYYYDEAEVQEMESILNESNQSGG
ncbi:MAG: hypothetical protein VX433_07290 [Candidatus Thermoplasmatota archaeon]|nr:hypothetical protein [Candidatus Thermoplasmatota archaeon]